MHNLAGNIKMVLRPRTSKQNNCSESLQQYLKFGKKDGCFTKIVAAMVEIWKNRWLCRGTNEI